MVGYHWSLAWWFGADDCNFWCFHTNFYNQNTIISRKLQTISISNSKLWSVIFDTWTLKFTIMLPVWSKNSACDTNSPQSWHNPYYSVYQTLYFWNSVETRNRSFFFHHEKFAWSVKLICREWYELCWNICISIIMIVIYDKCIYYIHSLKPKEELLNWWDYIFHFSNICV